MKISRKKKKGIISVPVASMGDVAFLLIIFFILCTRFATQTNVMPPKSLDVDAMEESQVTISVDAAGVIYWQGRRWPAGPEALEWKVKEIVKDKKTVQSRTVMFRCDKTVSRSVYEPVLEAIARGGGIIAAIGQKGVGDSIFAPTVDSGKTAKARDGRQTDGGSE